MDVKRAVLSWILAMLLGMGLFFLNVSAMTLEEIPCWQASPFLAAYTRSGKNHQDLGELYSLTWGQTRVLAYRVAPGNQAEMGDYSPGNLETLGETAGKLRAVILAGYPMIDANGLEEKANIWLRGQDKPEIENLQTGEALLATQIALWKLVEPEAFSETTLYGGWKDLTTSSWTGYRRQIRNSEMLSQRPTEHTSQNVRSLCAYLENRNPVEAKGNLISDDTLAQATYQAEQEENGSWQITVEVPLEVSIGDGESLVLKACCNGREQVAQVDGTRTYTFQFFNLSEPQAVTLTLEGAQQGGDVYLFSRENSQLLGWVEGIVPVRGELMLSPDRILQIRKSTSREEGNQPLANIQFNLYLVATMDQIQRGEVTLGPEPTAQEIESCQKPESLVAILSTDENGWASYNFTSGGDRDGVYLVVEQFCAGTTGPVDPFYITIPAEGAYTQEIHLENSLESQPEVTLSVTDRGRVEDSFGIGQQQNWYIWGSIPAGMSAARTYTLWDLLPESLDYQDNSVWVSLETRAGELLRLVPEIHYTISFAQRELEVALTPAGMAYAAANRGEGPGEPGILIIFQASLNEKAPIGTPISHWARLSYVNGAGISYSKTSSWTQIQTGGFSLCKTDPSGKPLAENTYRIARVLGEGEQATGEIHVDGEEIPVIYVSFLANGIVQEEGSTDEAGRAVFSGLSYGNYYLVEIRGTGEAPIPITVDSESYREDATIQLVSTRTLLPDTGGMGATALTAMGVVAMLSACCLLLINRKRSC